MRYFLVWLALVGGFVGCSTSKPQTAAQSLFNGRDLAGWVVMHGGDWTVEEGLLAVSYTHLTLPTIYSV